MNEMIERVARAMCKADGGLPNQRVSACRGPAAVMPNGYVTVFGDTVPHWRTYEPMARAAIAAMREPTATMIEAGAPAAFAGYAEDEEIARRNAKRGYEAMIDAALEGGE